MSLKRSEKFTQIEALVCTDVGRGTGKLMEATRGELEAAAQSLAKARSVGLVTGFFVPRGDTPAAETDGPVGTALLAAALAACGVNARIVTDTPCMRAVNAAVSAAGEAVIVDEVPLEGGTAGVAEAWKWAEVDHAISIERCGKSHDGKPRNMRGVDVSPWTAPLDDLFLRGGWRRLAVGDGGNEIGMGKLPRSLIAANVPNGEAIACATSCDRLIVAGVSNWGAYGLMAALAVVKPEWRDTIARFLTAERDLAVTQAVVDVGCIDGVTAKCEPTVDGYGPEVHGPLIEGLRRIACEGPAD